MNERLIKTKSAETIDASGFEKPSESIEKQIDTAIRKELNTYTAEQLKEILFAIPDDTFDTLKYLSKSFLELRIGRELSGGFLEADIKIAEASVEILWNRPGADFQERFSIIQKLEQAVSADIDETETWVSGYLNGLGYIASYDHNFFLQTLAGTFIKESDMNVSIEQRKAMLVSVWDERYELSDGNACILTGDHCHNIPTSARSINDLSEKTIRAITDGLLKEHVESRGFYGAREEYAMEKLQDNSLNERVMDPKISSILSTKDFNINKINLLYEYTVERIASSISPTLGAFYDGRTGMITGVFEKTDVPAVSEPTIETIQSMSALLLDINQAKIDKDTEEVSEYLESNSFLKKHPKFKEELQAQLTPKDNQTELDMSLAQRIMESLKEELSASAVPTKSLSEVIASRELFVGDKEVFLSNLYTAFSTARMRVFFEAYFDFSFADIPLHAQTQFLRYVWDKSKQDVDNARDFIRKGETSKTKTDRFISFLSLEHELQLGDKIVSFGNSVPNEIADALFEKYANIIETAEATQQFLRKEFNQDDGNSESIKLVAYAISHRATDLLTQYVMQTQDDYSRIPQELERIETDALAFSSAFKILKNRGELRLEDIKGVSLETESGNDFANHKNDVEKVRQLINTAYHSESNTFRATIVNSFERALTNPDTRFYALRRYGTLIASLRFDKIRNTNGNVTSKYFGSFVSDPTYGNGRLGEAVFEKAIEAEARDNLPIEARCNPLTPITQKYIEAGFTAYALNDFSGVPSLEIIFDATQNKNSKTKHWSIDRVIRETLTQNNDTVQTFSATLPKDIPFSLVNNGYMLTRYLKQDNRYYAVFERFPEPASSSESGENGVA